MGRMPKAADRLPAQRESVDIRALRAAIIEHEAELKWRDDTVAELKSERNWAVKKIKALEKELEQLQAEKAAGALTELVEPRTESRPITAGQADGKRKQVKVSADEEIGLELLKALHKVGELSGRNRSEVNVLDSQPGCKRQKLHWDYDPGLVAALGRKKKKPCSVILALQSGTRLLVRDEDAGENVAVPLAPGDILVFDGDVAHAGEWYASRNTRVHMYLDVDGVPREEDFTWFKRV